MQHNERLFNSLCSGGGSPKFTTAEEIKAKRNSAELVESPKIMGKKEYDELNMIQIKVCDIEE